jgi:hypothetical protein
MALWSAAAAKAPTLLNSALAKDRTPPATAEIDHTST